MQIKKKKDIFQIAMAERDNCVECGSKMVRIYSYIAENGYRKEERNCDNCGCTEA